MSLIGKNSVQFKGNPMNNVCLRFDDASQLYSNLQINRKPLEIK